MPTCWPAGPVPGARAQRGRAERDLRLASGTFLARLTALLADLGLEPKAAKTRIVLVNMNAGGGCDGGPDGCGSLRGDGGAWPSGDALRGESSNHPPVPRLKTVVLNGAGKVGT